jgi:hypothetical protein
VVGGSDQYNTAYRLDLSVLRARMMHMKVMGKLGKLGKLVRMWVGSQKERDTSCQRSSKNAYCERK